MIKSFCDELVGIKIAKLMAVYFNAVNEGVGRPTSIIFLRSSGKLKELMADGNGRVKFDENPLDKIYFDKLVGYSFVAPLLKAFDSALNGSETIQDVCLVEGVNKTIITLLMDNKMTLELRFEDDEIYLEVS
jgi:hypothetical protein